MVGATLDFYPIIELFYEMMFGYDEEHSQKINNAIVQDLEEYITSNGRDGEFLNTLTAIREIYTDYCPVRFKYYRDAATLRLVDILVLLPSHFNTICMLGFQHIGDGKVFITKLTKPFIVRDKLTPQALKEAFRNDRFY